MLYIDPPQWPKHGRIWSHLISDDSYQELHEFAEELGIPPRGFHRDHYDVPAELYDTAVASGATPTATREIVRVLVAKGLRHRPDR